jgi:hypothetical protein
LGAPALNRHPRTVQVAPEDPNAFPRTIKHINVSGNTPEYLAAKSRVTVGTCVALVHCLQSRHVVILLFTDGDATGVRCQCYACTVVARGSSCGCRRSRCLACSRSLLTDLAMVNCGESDDHTGYISEYPLMIRDDR